MEGHPLQSTWSTARWFLWQSHASYSLSITQPPSLVFRYFSGRKAFRRLRLPFYTVASCITREEISHLFRLIVEHLAASTTIGLNVLTVIMAYSASEAVVSVFSSARVKPQLN
jgi:hypothetical protein